MKRFVLSLALLMPLVSLAQSHHEIGFSAGVTYYYGDLQDKMFPNYGGKINGGIIYKYFFNPHVGLRFGANYTSITAADSLSDIPVKRMRNLRFASNLFEAHAALELNLLPIEVDKMKVTPYVFGGVALFHYNPYTDGLRGERVYLRPLATEGQNLPTYPDRKEYNLYNVSFPIGGGLKFFIGKTIMFTTELGFRYTNTDYLDDVSKSYVSLDTLAAYKGRGSVDLSFRTDELTRYTSHDASQPVVTPTWDGNYPKYKDQRGDSKANDWYYFANVTVTIYFRAFGNIKSYWQAQCPAFKNF